VIVALIVMVILAVVILAFVLEPIIKARMDQVEIDAAVDHEPVPDFRELLAEDDGARRAQPTSDDARPAVSKPEPAEHHS
jgi:hypothetical protein